MGRTDDGAEWTASPSGDPSNAHPALASSFPSPSRRLRRAAEKVSSPTFLLLRQKRRRRPPRSRTRAGPSRSAGDAGEDASMTGRRRSRSEITRTAGAVSQVRVSNSGPPGGRAWRARAITNDGGETGPSWSHGRDLGRPGDAPARDARNARHGRARADVFTPRRSACRAGSTPPSARRSAPTSKAWVRVSSSSPSPTTPFPCRRESQPRRSTRRALHERGPARQELGRGLARVSSPLRFSDKLRRIPTSSRTAAS